MAERAQGYGRLAEAARANPVQVRLGYIVGSIFVVLGILDVISTNWALEVGAYEINSFMRYLMEQLGVFWVLPKVMLQVLVATMVVWSPNRPTILIMALTCCWTSAVVISNFSIAVALSS